MMPSVTTRPEGRGSKSRGWFSLAIVVAIPVLMSGGLLGMAATGTTALPSIWWLVAQSVLAGAGATVAISYLLPSDPIKSRSPSVRLQLVAERLRELVSRHGETIGGQASTIQRLRDVVEQLETESAPLVDRSHGLASQVDESTRLAAAGNQSAEAARRSVAGAGEKFDKVAEEIARLDRRGDEVDLIMSYMEHLGSEMKQLGLGADTGANLSDVDVNKIQLVAVEMRGLGELAVEALRDIHARIQEIREACHSTQDAADEGRREVETALQNFGELETDLKQMCSWAEQNAGVVHQIEDFMARQADSLHEVFESMGGLDEHLAESNSQTQELQWTVNELVHAGERELVAVR